MAPEPTAAPPPTNANGDMSHRSGQMGPAGGGLKKFNQLLPLVPGMALATFVNGTKTGEVLEKAVISGGKQLATSAETLVSTATNVASALENKASALMKPATQAVKNAAGDVVQKVAKESLAPVAKGGLKGILAIIGKLLPGF
jgi:hypothetical protein